MKRGGTLDDLCALVEQVAAQTSVRMLGVDAVVATLERELEQVHRAVAELYTQVRGLRDRLDRHLPDGRL